MGLSSTPLSSHACPFIANILSLNGGRLPAKQFPDGEQSLQLMAKAVHGVGGAFALSSKLPLASISLGTSIAGRGGDAFNDDYKRQTINELLGEQPKKPRPPAPRLNASKTPRTVTLNASSASRAPHAVPQSPPLSLDSASEWDGMFRRQSKCPAAKAQKFVKGLGEGLGLGTRKPKRKSKALDQAQTKAASERWSCPAPIVWGRALLAATPPVRALRPQALPLKLAAVTAIAAGSNAPFGAWREHYEKFSVQWVILVHVAVPLVACLRKAVLLPRYAMLFTIAGSIAGQVAGSRLERQRMAVAEAASGMGLTVGAMPTLPEAVCA